MSLSRIVPEILSNVCDCLWIWTVLLLGWFIETYCFMFVYKQILAIFQNVWFLKSSSKTIEVTPGRFTEITVRRSQSNNYMRTRRHVRILISCVASLSMLSLRMRIVWHETRASTAASYGGRILTPMNSSVPRQQSHVAHASPREASYRYGGTVRSIGEMDAGNARFTRESVGLLFVRCVCD